MLTFLTVSCGQAAFGPLFFAEKKGAIIIRMPEKQRYPAEPV